MALEANPVAQSGDRSISYAKAVLSHLPSAAQRNRLSQASHVRNGARDHRTGWRATECATFAALDLHRGAV